MNRGRRSKRRHTFTPREKLDYYSKRVDNKKLSNTQRSRARNWMDGFNDSFYTNNLPAAQSELKRKRKNKGSTAYCSNILIPYINGMKTRSKMSKK